MEATLLHRSSVCGPIDRYGQIENITINQATPSSLHLCTVLKISRLGRIGHRYEKIGKCEIYDLVFPVGELINTDIERTK